MIYTLTLIDKQCTHFLIFPRSFFYLCVVGLLHFYYYYDFFYSSPRRPCIYFLKIIITAIIIMRMKKSYDRLHSFDLIIVWVRSFGFGG